jgi:hypothetical protein
VKAGISGGGPGIVVVVVGPGTVVVVGSDGDGIAGPPIVVDVVDPVVGVLAGGRFGTVVGVGDRPAARPGTATGATIPAAIAATRRTRARRVPNIPTHVGKSARDLQDRARCPD